MLLVERKDLKRFFIFLIFNFQWWYLYFINAAAHRSRTLKERVMATVWRGHADAVYIVTPRRHHNGWLLFVNKKQPTSIQYDDKQIILVGNIWPWEITIPIEQSYFCQPLTIFLPIIRLLDITIVVTVVSTYLIWRHDGKETVLQQSKSVLVSIPFLPHQSRRET